GRAGGSRWRERLLESLDRKRPWESPGENCTVASGFEVRPPAGSFLERYGKGTSSPPDRQSALPSHSQPCSGQRGDSIPPGISRKYLSTHPRMHSKCSPGPNTLDISNTRRSYTSIERGDR